MISLKIDNRDVQAREGQTILDIAREQGIEIPVLCHDERVKTYGACGLCVVEVEGWNKLVRACSTEVSEGMAITTESDRIYRSRQATLEMLFSDHTGDCRPPCLRACPAQVDCQGYVGLIANGQYDQAIALLKEYYPIPASIGLVCPHPCETACRRQMVEEPIAIAQLKTFVACLDLDSENPLLPPVKEPSGKKAAVVGAGPAGLTAAYFLAQQGHEVTVYDAMPEPGGMLRYGIPEYRLPKAILAKEIDLIRRLGVKFVSNTRIPDDVRLSALRDQYDAVFLGIGAWTSSKIGCPGDDNQGVVGGIDFLREVAMGAHPEIGQRVAVIGGGNTAMDAARTAVRAGAKEVMVMYRRTQAEMPAEDIEIQEAQEEGVIFKFLMAPQEIQKDNHSLCLKMQQMELGEPDASGRRRPVPIPGAVENIRVDTIIAAIGQQVNAGGLDEIQLSRWGSVDADEITFMTSMDGVFAGGDGVSGPGIAIEAVAQGKKAAEAMNSYLQGDEYRRREKYWAEQKLVPEVFAEYTKVPRVHSVHEDPVERRGNFELVTHILSEEDAAAEASRCLECGCADYFECRLVKYAEEYQVQPEKLAGEKHMAGAVEEAPFFIRDMNKCILCGLCVRVCDEVMGVNALGLVHRGFDTVVQPEFGLPLPDSSCISCGQCVALCPTGALAEKSLVQKNVPTRLDQTISACSFCSQACTMTVMNRGNQVVKIVPGENNILCSLGRFAWARPGAERLKHPLLKKNGVLTEVSWEEAEQAANMLLNVPGDGQDALFISPACTLEEAQSAAAWAGWGGKPVYQGSFSANDETILFQIFGSHIPRGSFEHLQEADLLIMLGAFNHNQIPAVKARQAAKNGTRLVIISTEDSVADDAAYRRICPSDNTTRILQQIVAAAIQSDDVQCQAGKGQLKGLEMLETALTGVSMESDAYEIGQLYAAAHKPMVLIDGFSVTEESLVWMANLVGLKTPQSSIVYVTPGANTAGIHQTGFTYGAADLMAMLQAGSVRGLIIVNEDPVGTGILDGNELQRAGSTVLMSPFKTATAQFADLVIPCSTPLETAGTYINAEGLLCSVQTRLKPEDGITLTGLFNNLAALREGKEDQAGSEVSTSTPEEPAAAVQLKKPQGNTLFTQRLTSDILLNTFTPGRG